MSSFTVPPHDATSPAPLDYERRMTARSPLGLNLFWRTFCLLALLLVGSILAWLQTLRAFEFEPRTPSRSPRWSTSAARPWCIRMPSTASR